jgi:hypothetical protein
MLMQLTCLTSLQLTLIAGEVQQQQQHAMLCDTAH